MREGETMLNRERGIETMAERNCQANTSLFLHSLLCPLLATRHCKKHQRYCPSRSSWTDQHSVCSQCVCGKQNFCRLIVTAWQWLVIRELYSRRRRKKSSPFLLHTTKHDDDNLQLANFLLLMLEKETHI